MAKGNSGVTGDIEAAPATGVSQFRGANQMTDLSFVCCTVVPPLRHNGDAVRRLSDAKQVLGSERLVRFVFWVHKEPEKELKCGREAYRSQGDL